jgi:predicted ABC-type ATPase
MRLRGESIRNPPQRGAIRAGREVLRRAHEYIRRAESFAIETTLAGGWTNSAIEAALQEGFTVRLFYVCVKDPEENIRRVRERVARGGHYVPDEDVRRRYWRSLENAWSLVRIVDQALVYDNSGEEPRLLFEMRSGVVVTIAASLPRWAAGLLGD